MRAWEVLAMLSLALFVLWLVASFARPEVAGMFAGAFGGLAMVTVSLFVTRWRGE